MLTNTFNSTDLKCKTIEYRLPFLPERTLRLICTYIAYTERRLIIPYEFEIMGIIILYTVGTLNIKKIAEIAGFN